MGNGGQLIPKFYHQPLPNFLTIINFINLIPDPTTTGISDSDYAMTKETPKETPLVVDKYGDGQEFTERKD